MAKNHFALLSLLPLLVSAGNDWSQPCLDGWCSYDIPSSDTSMAGSMSISGSTNSISDITTAAGWEILNCTADSPAQDIRIVCSGNEASCSHLFQDGAEHTIVRLPDSCGSSPFAHVVQSGEADDQSLPEHISSRIRRRDGTIPTVHTLSFDTNFDQVPSNQRGEVEMLIVGSTIPGFTGNATITPAGSRRRSRLQNKRSIFGSIFGGFTDFNKSASTNPLPINIDQKFNIFNTTLSCSENEQAKLSVDVDAKFNAEVSIGVVIAGSIIPPNIKQFGLFSGISADVDGGLSIDANIAGEIDTGKIPIFSVGLPGLDIKDIFSVGPTFDIDVEAKATIDLDVNMSVDLAYGVSDLQLFFPPSAGQTSSANVAPKDTPLKLSASPDVSSNATLEAHLIPSLNFGLKLLGASATVFLDVDTFAALDLGLEAGATVSVDTDGNKGASAQVGGCVDVNGGVSINAGAEGSFFGLFDSSAQIALFSKDFDFFKKCFSDSVSTTLPASASATSATILESDSASATSSLISESALTSTAESSSSAEPSATELSSNAEPSATESTSTDINQSAVSSSAASAISISSYESSISETSILPSASTTSDSSAVPSSSSTSASPVATSSPASNKRFALTRRRAGSPIQLKKRAFQCLAADIAAATSIVDEALSSANFAPSK